MVKHKNNVLSQSIWEYTLGDTMADGFQEELLGGLSGAQASRHRLEEVKLTLTGDISNENFQVSPEYKQFFSLLEDLSELFASKNAVPSIFVKIGPPDLLDELLQHSDAKFICKLDGYTMLKPPKPVHERAFLLLQHIMANCFSGIFQKPFLQIPIEDRHDKLLSQLCVLVKCALAKAKRETEWLDDRTLSRAISTAIEKKDYSGLVLPLTLTAPNEDEVRAATRRMQKDVFGLNPAVAKSGSTALSLGSSANTSWSKKTALTAIATSNKKAPPGLTINTTDAAASPVAATSTPVSEDVNLRAYATVGESTPSPSPADALQYMTPPQYSTPSSADTSQHNRSMPGSGTATASTDSDSPAESKSAGLGNATPSPSPSQYSSSVPGSGTTTTTTDSDAFSTPDSAVLSPNQSGMPREDWSCILPELFLPMGDDGKRVMKEVVLNSEKTKTKGRYSDGPHPLFRHQDDVGIVSMYKQTRHLVPDSEIRRAIKHVLWLEHVKPGALAPGKDKESRVRYIASNASGLFKLEGEEKDFLDVIRSKYKSDLADMKEQVAEHVKGCIIKFAQSNRTRRAVKHTRPIKKPFVELCMKECEFPCKGRLTEIVDEMWSDVRKIIMPSRDELHRELTDTTSRLKKAKRSASVQQESLEKLAVNLSEQETKRVEAQAKVQVAREEEETKRNAQREATNVATQENLLKGVDLGAKIRGSRRSRSHSPSPLKNARSSRRSRRSRSPSSTSRPSASASPPPTMMDKFSAAALVFSWRKQNDDEEKVNFLRGLTKVGVEKLIKGLGSEKRQNEVMLFGLLLESGEVNGPFGKVLGKLPDLQQGEIACLLYEYQSSSKQPPGESTTGGTQPNAGAGNGRNVGGAGLGAAGDTQAPAAADNDAHAHAPGADNDAHAPGADNDAAHAPAAAAGGHNAGDWLSCARGEPGRQELMDRANAWIADPNAAARPLLRFKLEDNTYHEGLLETVNGSWYKVEGAEKKNQAPNLEIWIANA